MLFAVILLATSAASLILDDDQVDGETASAPEISDAGFVKDKTAFFYYAKFATSGFAYTNGSASGDTPAKGVGTTMQDNTLYASLSKLDRSVQYYLLIEEYNASGSLNYGVAATLNPSAVHTFVYMSVADGIPYTDGKALACTALSGSSASSFTASPSDSLRYEFVLSTTASTGGSVANATVEDPMEFSKVCAAEYKEVAAEDGVSNIGKNYGYMSSGAAQYAGKVLTYDAGRYVCVFLLSNIDPSKLTLTISNGSTYTVPSSDILVGKNVSTGYYYAIVSEDTLTGAGLGSDLGSASVSVGDGRTVYSTYTPAAADDDDDDGTSSDVIIAVVVIVIIVVVCAVAILKVTKKV